MPKISDEFKPAPTQAKPAQPRVQPAATQGQQPVTRPAPMAPRTPAPMAPRMPAQAQAQPQQRPVAPLPQGAAGLGDRLRAERQAAERLAEHRVAQARGNRPPAPPPAPPAMPQPQPQPQPQSQRPVQPAPQPQPQSQRPVQPAPQPQPQSQRPAQPERPKFTFSPEELAKDKREAAPPPQAAEREYPAFSGKAGAGAPPPPLTPPRPALGGNAAAQRPQAQPPKPPAAGAPPAGAGFQPRYNAPPQPPGGNYRSLDPPPGGSFTPKSRPYADTAAFREDPLIRREPPPPPPPRPPANREYESYRRGPALPPAPVAQPAYSEEFDGPSLPDYRRRPPVPARGRQPAPGYDEGVNEVFEDEEPPRPQRRRASMQDYNRAYRDYEEGYEAEPRRRRGPWPALLAIFAVGLLLTGGIIYYYLTYMKQPGQANGDNVPIIEAPDASSKTAPENGAGSTQGPGQATDAQRKQIYDRILGDDEVNSGQNQVVPTQEQPQAVEPTGNSDGQGAAPIPTPSSGAPDNSAEPLPLPLPPPGATDQQGQLPSQTNQQTAAMGATNGAAPPSPVPEPASTSAADNGAPVPGQLARATEEIASAPPPTAEQVVSEPEALPPQPQPAKPKVKAEKKPVKKVAAAEGAANGGQDGAIEPLVLVPPAQPVATSPAPVVESAPVQQTTESAASEEKSKSFFNFGSGPTGKRKLTGKAAENAQARGATTSGNWANSPDPNAVEADSSGAAPAPQQIAAISPAPEPQPIPMPEPEQPAQKAKPSSGGFNAQLASFRSEAEAQAEFDRLRSKHSGVLGGLNSRIVKATVAGASRYRLSVGPMASRDQAMTLCKSLIAAGERDCLVRGN